MARGLELDKVSSNPNHSMITETACISFLPLSPLKTPNPALVYMRAASIMNRDFLGHFFKMSPPVGSDVHHSTYCLNTATDRCSCRKNEYPLNNAVKWLFCAIPLYIFPKLNSVLLHQVRAPGNVTSFQWSWARTAGAAGAVAVPDHQWLIQEHAGIRVADDRK